VTDMTQTENSPEKQWVRQPRRFARRIIGKLKNGAPAGATPLLGPGFGGVGGIRPPTPAMKRFAVTISRQKRVSLPAGSPRALKAARSTPGGAYQPPAAYRAPSFCGAADH
jgi:hypothetical protein